MLNAFLRKGMWMIGTPSVSTGIGCELEFTYYRNGTRARSGNADMGKMCLDG
jgi:hypothetical protein